MRRRVIRLLVAIAVLGLATLPVFGQYDRGQGQPISGQIIGQVRYAEGNLPVFNVMVSCDSFGHGFIGQETTDRNGKFQFSGLKADQYVIIIRIPGYVEERQETELYTTASQYLQFRLKPDASVRTPPTAPAVVDANVTAEARREFEKADALLATNKKENIEGGVHHLEKALKIDGKFLQAALKLGTAYMDLGQSDKAENALKKVIEIDPKTFNAFFALGELYLQQRRYAEGETVLRRGLALENRSWQGHFTLGRLYLQNGDTVKAARQIAITIQLNPNCAQAHLLAGNILLKAGKREDALAEFQEYLHLVPNGQYAAQTREVVQKIRLPSNKQD